MPPWKESDMSTPVNYPETTQPSNNLIAHDTGMSPQGQQVHADGKPASVSADSGQEQIQLMSALGICRDGRRYCFRNYCSVRLQDAVTYARLVAKRELYASGGR
jgi:hypothetical protein